MKPTLFLSLLLISHTTAASPITRARRGGIDGRKNKDGDNDDDDANHFVTLCADKIPNDDDSSNKNAWGQRPGCRPARFDVGKCAGVGGDMDDRVSAVDPRGFDCTFYAEPGCRGGGRSLPVRGPNGNLFDNSGLDDVLSSFLCWR
ncbi:hypothetical protein F5X99DRAFT_423969 [Biscogniauxia marginata]|nr:hypothetical protein F5X99DRAFT_423969 [Biscogniauxia marginata]